MQNIIERTTPESAEQYDDWQKAEDALNAAKKMTAGPERSVALRRAGQMRFDAYERKRSVEESMARDNERLRCGHPRA